MSIIAPIPAQQIGEVFAKSEKILAEKYGVDVKFTLFDRNIFKSDASLISPAFTHCRIGALGKKGIEPIDIFDFSHLSILPPDFVAHDLSLKMMQHLAASKTDRVMIGRHGTKLDLRSVKNCKFTVDEEGYLKVNGCRLLDENFKVILLNDFHSQTIIRAFDHRSSIVLFDEKSIALNCSLNIDVSIRITLKTEDKNEYYRCSKLYIDAHWANKLLVELARIDRSDLANYKTCIRNE
jgi:hypothetical protein